ncbi:aldose epimerase family protein [Clostridium paraputrificum]|uniref:aldose epimerase family protein n=1 Tax=Clostridium paraputrificum TaxID=29363 RepID=UPI003D327693
MRIDKKEIALKDNKKILQYSLSNDNGIEIKILTLGGIITDIIVPDSKGIRENIVIGWKDLNDYIDDTSYAGAIVGRNSGRIADGKIKIGNKLYETTKNQESNTHHGGNEGFNKKIWKDCVEVNDNEATLILEASSKDGEEGFPGNLKLKVVYSLNNENKFSIKNQGISDKDTILNMTNHSYFNLSGNIKRNVLDERLTVKSDKIATIREDSALTGDLIDVKGTAFDFNTSKKVGEDIGKVHRQLELGNGYDHPWVLRNGDGYNIKLEDDISGRVMEVYTDRKAVVIYSTNFTVDKKLANGNIEGKYDGICFETQNLPIGEGCKFIEDSLVREGEEYRASTVFSFYCS